MQNIKLIIILSSFIFCDFTNDSIVLETIQKKGIQYFSLNDFVYKNNLKSTYYEAKEKLEIIYEGNKIYFSPHSAYCKINNNIYNLTYETQLINNKLYVPVLAFQKILNTSKIQLQISSVSSKDITIQTNLYTLNDFYIDKKENGIVIAIQTSKEFLEKDIATSVSSSGWLNITIIDSKIDSAGFQKANMVYPVVKTKTIQANKSSQISYLVKKQIDNIVVIVNKSNIELLLTIGQESYANKIQAMRKKWLIDTIIIDPGHGGKDPGAVGANNIKEKNITLEVSKQIGSMIERTPGLRVVYTREEDVFVPLWRRTQIANNMHGDLFISLHANSSKHKETKGFETYLLRVGKINDAIEVASRENSVILLEQKEHKYTKFDDEKIIVATMAQNAALKSSEIFAELVQNNLSKSINSKNRGVKQAGFHVLVGASMPNVLIEMGFLSNKEEGKQLNSATQRRKIAKAIFDSIIEFKAQYE